MKFFSLLKSSICLLGIYAFECIRSSCDYYHFNRIFVQSILFWTHFWRKNHLCSTRKPRSIQCRTGCCNFSRYSIGIMLSKINFWLYKQNFFWLFFQDIHSLISIQMIPEMSLMLWHHQVHVHEMREVYLLCFAFDSSS